MNRSYKIFWTPTAKNDFSEILGFIALDSRTTAVKIVEKIEKQVKELQSFPERGRIIPELQKNNIVKYRELIIAPWRIFYNIENNNVYIHAVVDGRRDMEAFLLRRQLR